MTRDKIVETMARAIDPTWWIDNEPDSVEWRKKSLWEANAALHALEAAGLVVVPREPDDRMRSAGESAASIGIGKPVDDEAIVRVFDSMISASLGEKGE